MGNIKKVYPSEMGKYPSLFLWDVPEYGRKHFSKYYLLHWETQYFMEQRLMYLRSLQHQSEDYFIHYYDCTERDIELSLQVQISFRKLEGSAVGIALVRPKAMQLPLQFTQAPGIKDDRRKK